MSQFRDCTRLVTSIGIMIEDIHLLRLLHVAGRRSSRSHFCVGGHKRLSRICRAPSTYPYFRVWMKRTLAHMYFRKRCRLSPLHRRRLLQTLPHLPVNSWTGWNISLLFNSQYVLILRTQNPRTWSGWYSNNAFSLEYCLVRIVFPSGTFCDNVGFHCHPVRTDSDYVDPSN
jgi:hypothetical protein